MGLVLWCHNKEVCCVLLFYTVGITLNSVTVWESTAVSEPESCKVRLIAVFAELVCSFDFCPKYHTMPPTQLFSFSLKAVSEPSNCREKSWVVDLKSFVGANRKGLVALRAKEFECLNFLIWYFLFYISQNLKNVFDYRQSFSLRTKTLRRFMCFSQWKKNQTWLYLPKVRYFIHGHL